MNCKKQSYIRHPKVHLNWIATAALPDPHLDTAPNAIVPWAYTPGSTTAHSTPAADLGFYKGVQSIWKGHRMSTVEKILLAPVVLTLGGGRAGAPVAPSIPTPLHKAG